MIETLFGAKYFGYIASAWGVSLAALVLMALWVRASHRARRRELERLERAGLRRAAQAAQDAQGARP